MDQSNIISLAAVVISFLSLAFSIVCYVRDARLKKRADEQDGAIRDQDEALKGIQIQLGELQLREAEEAEQRRTESKVEARHVSKGPKKHALRIANTGGTTVSDVTCTYDEANAPYAFIQDEEPFERLEPGDSFDETLVMAMGSPSKFVVVTHWKDSEGVERSRENIVTW